MHSKKFNFTMATLENLAIDKSGKTVFYFDKGQRSLCIAVSPKGNKAFYMWRKVRGRKVRFKLGTFPDFNLKDARSECSGYLKRIDKGENIELQRKENREEQTLESFFQIYLERHAKPHKKSWKFEQQYFINHIQPKLGKRLLTEITQSSIQKLHHAISEKKENKTLNKFTKRTGGKIASNRCLSLLKLIFNKAREWGYYPAHIDPPTRYVKPFKEKSRERFLQSDEMPRFFEELNSPETPPVVRDYIIISLFTGARKSNVLSMTWHEVNLEREEWNIPETKNGEPLTIPIVGDALEVLKQRKKEASSIFVFPSTGKTGHLQDPKRAWKSMLERAEIENLTLHDLRRTLGSWQTMAGATPFVVGRSLGHKSLKSTQIYARMNLDPVREAVTKAGELITMYRDKK